MVKKLRIFKICIKSTRLISNLNSSNLNIRTLVSRRRILFVAKKKGKKPNLLYVLRNGLTSVLYQEELLLFRLKNKEKNTTVLRINALCLHHDYDNRWSLIYFYFFLFEVYVMLMVSIKDFFQLKSNSVWLKNSLS